jgi:hypothetical protein
MAKRLNLDFISSTPFIPENEKENEQGENSLAVKLQHAADGSIIPSHIMDFCLCFIRALSISSLNRV